MPVTPQHELLTRMLDYTIEQAKDINPKAYNLKGSSDFKLSPENLAGLPGIKLDQKIEGDYVWLQVERLTRTPPPAPHKKIQPYIIYSDDPNDPPPALNEQELQKQLAADKSSMSEEIAATRDKNRRECLAKALKSYTPLWQAWAEKEKPRRRTIKLYEELFTLKDRLEAEETSNPSELVWGMGVSAWKVPYSDPEDGKGKEDKLDYLYPLLTQSVEIDSDPETHTISVRPRDVVPRLEFDLFIYCRVRGAAEVEDRAKMLLESESEHLITPFDVSSFEPILKLAAGSLDKAGRYEPDYQGLPTPSAELLVTAGWVLFVRRRPTNFLIEDMRRLKARLETGDEIPPGPACFVTPPSDEVVKYEPISFRGLCSGSRAQGEPRELYFPLPYNQEQETIIEMLEQTPGVCVQGPPGTGKTHTIANIICHYLATGRKVLVTSKGEHALSVLQEKIPESVRPLTVALLAGDKKGMRQFQASIEAISQNLSQLNVRTTEGEIERCKQQIEAAHAEIARIDKRVDQIAFQHLAEIEIDGVKMRPQKMAELVVTGREQHGWFEDDLTLQPEHAPPLSDTEVQRLREARRRLGPDLIYLSSRLPSSFELLPAEEVSKLHETLVAIREIEDAEAEGELPELRASTPEVLEEARQMLAEVEQVLEILRRLEESENPWAFDLRAKCRHHDFTTEQKVLKALLDDLEELVQAREAFLLRPVSLPPEVLNNPKVIQAIERARKTGKPFGLMSFGKGDVKQQVDAIRIAGLPPKTVDDWMHVHRYVELHKNLLSFSVRWDQMVQKFSVPEIRADVEALDSTERIARAAKSAHQLATVHDANLLRMAEKVFRKPPKDKLLASSSELQTVREQLSRHLKRADLANAHRSLSILQEKLAGTSGPVVERLRAFIDSQLGNPQLPTERIVTQYADIISEIKRIESLSSVFTTINDLCARIEQAGARKWADRLRSQSVPSNGDDEVLPTSWREAWNWARIKNHLQKIEARDELLDLAEKRRKIERVLARQYEELVAKSAWLEAKKQASPKVLSALESYRVAIQKIGKGTGPNAPRYRRDAQKAMREAQGAIPCWIMSHAKVSESMPDQLGIFDLVIVDEASQSNILALPVVLRGKKILVVGDDKQVSSDGRFISPTKIMALRERFLSDHPFGQDFTRDKSLYDAASTVFAAQRVTLLEHFRCVQPIIAYSNKTFYDNKIRPLRVPKASERIDPPLVDVFVEGGIRNGRDINKMEAEFIAAEIEAILRNPSLRNRTIGVVSLLGNEQAKFIYDLVIRRVDLDELERRKFTCGDAHVFQGSERDIMFLSMVADTKNHSPLSDKTAEQRFNVAASRARDRMYLVRSIELEDLLMKDFRRTLVEYFRMPLEGTSEEKNLIDLCESEFERDVYSSLVSLGYRVTPQVRVGPYRIDMVVEGANDTRLAIECDGDEYHGPDRWPADMQRQRILERAGWVFWRCFASTWSLRKKEVLEELRERLSEMGIEPLGALERLPSVVERRVWSMPNADLDDADFDDIDQKEGTDASIVDAMAAGE